MRFKTLSIVAVSALLAACVHEKPVADSTAATVTPATTGASMSKVDELKAAGDRIFFGTDKSDISSESSATLERQAAFAKKYPELTFTIEGHADERGTREYNLALGERRATAAKKALASLGVAATRLQTISYGKERPAVVGHTEAAWAQNRRAVTVIN